MGNRDQQEIEVDHDNSSSDEDFEQKPKRQQAFDKKDQPISKFEQERAELESAPVIPRSECSPAAFIFN